MSEGNALKAIEVALSVVILVAILGFWGLQIGQFSSVTANRYFGGRSSGNDIDLFGNQGIYKDILAMPSYQISASGGLVQGKNFEQGTTSGLISISGESLIASCVAKKLSSDASLQSEYLYLEDSVLSLDQMDSWSSIEDTSFYTCAIAVTDSRYEDEVKRMRIFIWRRAGW